MEYLTLLKKYLPPVLCGVLVLLALKFLLPVTLPVVLGISGAGLLSPLIRQVQARLNLRHGTAAALCVSGVLLLLGLGLILGGRLLFSEVTELYGRLPGLLESISGRAQIFVQRAGALSQELPGGAGDAISDWSQELISSGGSLATKLYDAVFSLVSGFLSQLPDNLLFLLTLILSFYFSAAELPRLRALLRQHLSQKRRAQLSSLGKSLKSVVSGWLRAQIKLMGVTFLILLGGFLVLRVELPLLLALGVSLLDALPLFGVGTVLLPWGLVSMLSGDMRLGVGLMILYGIAALTRNVLEPRFLGAQMGVSPLLTLLAIYVGYRVSGFVGMLLLPILVMLGAEVLETEKRPEVYDLPAGRQFRPMAE